MFLTIRMTEHSHFHRVFTVVELHAGVREVRFIEFSQGFSRKQLLSPKVPPPAALLRPGKAQKYPPQLLSPKVIKFIKILV